MSVLNGGLGAVPNVPNIFSQNFNAVPKKQEPKLRGFGDPSETRKLIYDNVLEAARTAPPIVNKNFTLNLSDVDYDGPEDFSLKEQKAAVLEGRTLGRKLRGTWQLTDNTTGEVIDSKKTTLARIPYLTQRGTFIHNGSEYTLINQLRLKPGIYTRMKDNGEIEAHANIMPGKGLSHRYFLDPAKGQFYLHLSQAKIPLMPLLRAFGAKDKDLQEAWGPELYASNIQKDDTHALKKLYDKIVKSKDANDDDNVRRNKVIETFRQMELDPEVTGRTLGKPYGKIDLDSVLDTTKKLIGVSRGDIDPDDRDDLANQVAYGPEDLLSERISKDAGRLRWTLLWKAGLKRNLSHIQPGALNPQIDAALLSSGLGQAPEEVNALEILDKQTRVTRLGEGGIPSLESIPDSSRSVQPSHFGFIDSLRTPESLRAGVDVYFTSGARKGAGGVMYTPLTDMKSGQTVYKTPQELAHATVAFPGELEKPDRRIVAMRRGKLMYVDRNEVDFVQPHFEDAFSHLSNLIPLKSTVKGQRVAMGSRMLTQSLPLENPEAPFVQSAMPTDANRSYEEEYSNYAGAVRAAKPGTVTAVTPDGITVRHADGTEQTHDLYDNFYLNRKTAIHNYPNVKVGQPVNAGDLLAYSNQTDKNGVTAIGKNLRVHYIARDNFEDSISISESAAKKLTSEHAYQHSLDWTDKHKLGKSTFLGMFPKTFDRATVENIGDDGIIKVGSTVQYGQPLVLATKQKELTQNKIHRRHEAAFNDASELWNHHTPGVVTDVVKTKNGVNVVVKTMMPMEVGDKLSGRYGDKGVIARIIPDHLMPSDEQGRPAEVLLNPLGIISRCYDEQTEFLTESGWKFGRSVADTDKLVCFHPWSQNLYLMNQLEPFYKAHYAGDMLKFENKLMDFCVTPNHRMWVKCGYPGAEWQETTAERIYQKNWIIPVAGNPISGAKSDFVLPHIEYSKKDNSSDKSDIVIDAGDWAEFLGWYIAEGNVDEKVHISQSQSANPEKCFKIASLLNKLPFKWFYSDKNTQFHITSKRLCSYLSQFGLCDGKFIPSWLFEQPFEVRQRFIDAYFDGDGSSLYNKQGSPIAGAGTRSKQLAEDVQRLLIYQGISANVYPVKTKNKNKPMWRCAYHFRRERVLEDKNWSREQYDGYVYCPTVPTGYIVTRRNGKIVIAGNTNPSQIIEAVLGKISEKTGKPYKVQDFKSIADMNQFAMDEAKKHGIKDLETIIDPETGRKIPETLVGNRFFMKLMHTSAGKAQSRGLAGYTSAGEPSKGGESGSKRMSMMSVNAIMAHGGYAVLRDGTSIRGQRNEEFWVPFMRGLTPPKPKIPMVYDKFINDLKAAGINVVPENGRTNIMAMTDADVDRLAADREIRSGDTVQLDKGMAPVPGGLFDERLTGGHSQSGRWSYIKLHEPMVNPIMEDPVRRILGLTEKKFLDVLAGKEKLPDGGTGPSGLRKALENINVTKEIATARMNIASGRKTIRDQAVRKLAYLKSAQNLGIHPKDWMVTKVPVMPPVFRPISMLGDTGMPLVSDPNYMYKELFDANDNLKEISKELADTGDERLAVYNAYKALTGLADPVHPKLKEKNVKGLLANLFGTSPKTSMLQQRLIGSTVDLVGRAVVSPDPNLDMDHIGLPEEKAWELYKNFIIRRLHRRGMPVTEAARHVKDQTKLARDTMIEEMESRPVIADRAPILHRFGLMAFYPKLYSGHTLRTSPLIVSGFGMDFDGDTMQYHVPVDDEAAKQAVEKMLPSKNLISPSDMVSPMHMPKNEYTGGLYAATARTGYKPRAHVFHTKRDAINAWKRGLVDIRDDVQIIDDSA